MHPLPEVNKGTRSGKMRKVTNMPLESYINTTPSAPHLLEEQETHLELEKHFKLRKFE